MFSIFFLNSVERILCDGLLGKRCNISRDALKDENRSLLSLANPFSSFDHLVACVPGQTEDNDSAMLMFAGCTQPMYTIQALLSLMFQKHILSWNNFNTVSRDWLTVLPSGLLTG